MLQQENNPDPANPSEAVKLDKCINFQKSLFDLNRWFQQI